jgi:hypothetical protein
MLFTSQYNYSRGNLRYPVIENDAMLFHYYYNSELLSIL